VCSSRRSSLADAIASFVFPQGCHACGAAVALRAEGVACGDCWAATRLLSGGPCCERCGLPGAGRCVACGPEGLPVARSAGAYAGALRVTLLDLKRRPRPCGRLVGLLADAYRANPVLHATDLVVPVPLHPERRAERGHNQAEPLAEAVARVVGCDAVPQALARTARPVGHRMRAGASRAERREAVRGAFAAAGKLVVGRVVLIVDDVFTTGSTLAECATALRAAGARDVLALTAARAL
jgi:ComF family protein